MDSLANAGGNKSVAYVSPTLEAFSNALGEVVASYFSPISLQNRLNIPSNPFEEDLKLAVTAQKLIGEPIGGAQKAEDIPISLVLFSNEPLYIHGEEFRIMRLSATYGHGEGVVGNQGINSDTILIIQSVAHPDQITFHQDIRSKPERLAPQLNPETGKVELRKMANPPELVERAALSEDQLRRLYEWAIVGEKFFDDFTDMEIVLKNDKIYPVQARPVNREAMLPTYLNPKKLEKASNSPIVKILPMQMIVPGKASVVDISKASELLLSETLEKAQGEYRKGEHKAVVVGKEEPSNSHPVVNFSSWSMPCLYAKDLEAAKEIAKAISEKYHVAFCVQSARAFLWDISTGDVADFSSEGFIVHPAQIFKSLSVREQVPEHAGVLAEPSKEIADILMAMQMSTTKEQSLKWLQELEASAFLNEFKAKIVELETISKNEPLQAKTLAPMIAATKAVDAAVERALEELHALLANSKHHGKMEILFHTKVLQTLLFQTKADKGLAQHSVVSLQSAFAAADALVDYQRKLDHPAHFAALLMDGSQSPIEETFSQWQNLLLELEPLAEKEEIPEADIARFKDTLQTMRQTDVLPIFMTFFLSQVVSVSTIQKVEAINAFLPSEESPRIQELLGQRQLIGRMKQDIGLFGDGKTYPEAWSRLQEIVAPFLPPKNSWMKKDSWDALSPITRNIAIQTLNELVDMYDSSIKSMKASTSITDEVKVDEFEKMLSPYFELLNSWAVGTVGEGGYLLHEHYPLKTILRTVKSTMKETRAHIPDLQNQLNRSPSFSVSSAVVGSATLFHMFAPKRLEDIFMFTHQSLEATLSAMITGTISPGLVQESNLPITFKYFFTEIPKMKGKFFQTIQQTGIEAGPSDKKDLTFYYK